MSITCKKIINQLVSFGTRQNETALEASAYIQRLLRDANITFVLEAYFVDLPVWSAWSLDADGEAVACLPTGLTSGTLTKKDKKTTSLIPSKHFFTTPHINFNEQCETISRANFSLAPSLAISKKDLEKVTNANQLQGEVRVEKVLQKTEQILVGNMKNPTVIVFSHFDSVGTGAIDNASGTAVCLDMIFENKHLLETTLFVFDGNEEVSFDTPVYWGKGYRNFQATYASIMNTCETIVVVDCVGYGQTQVVTEGELLSLAFPIEQIETYTHKIRLVTSDYDRLMMVYHSDADDGSLVEDVFLKEATRFVKQLIEKY